MAIPVPTVSASAAVTVVTVEARVSFASPHVVALSFVRCWRVTSEDVPVGISTIVPVAHSPPEAEAA